MGNVIGRFFTDLFFEFLFSRTSFTEEWGQVRWPKIIGIIGIVGFFLLLILTIGAILEGEALFLVLIGVALTVLSPLLLVVCVNIRIDYDEKGFTYRNFWRKEKTFRYSQVTRLKFANTAVYIYIDKQKIEVADPMSGSQMFVKTLKKHTGLGQ